MEFYELKQVKQSRHNNMRINFTHDGYTLEHLISHQFSEPLSSQYCQQFDDFKKDINLLETWAKQNER